MKYANKIGAKYSVIIGDSELENNSVELKEMETGEKETVVLSELAEVLKAKLKEDREKGQKGFCPFFI